MPNSCITKTKVHNKTRNYQHMREHTKSNFQHLHTKDSKLAFWTCHGAGFVVLFVQVHRVFMFIAKTTQKDQALWIKAIPICSMYWDMKTYTNGWTLWQIHVEKNIPVPWNAHLDIIKVPFSTCFIQSCETTHCSWKWLPSPENPPPVTSLHSCTDSPWGPPRGKVNQEGLRFPMSNESDVFSKRF